MLYSSCEGREQVKNRAQRQTLLSLCFCSDMAFRNYSEKPYRLFESDYVSKMNVSLLLFIACKNVNKFSENIKRTEFWTAGGIKNVVLPGLGMKDVPRVPRKKVFLKLFKKRGECSFWNNS